MKGFGKLCIGTKILTATTILLFFDHRGKNVEEVCRNRSNWPLFVPSSNHLPWWKWQNITGSATLEIRTQTCVQQLSSATTHTLPYPHCYKYKLGIRVVDSRCLKNYRTGETGVHSVQTLNRFFTTILIHQLWETRLILSMPAHGINWKDKTNSQNDLTGNVHTHKYYEILLL